MKGLLKIMLVAFLWVLMPSSVWAMGSVVAVTDSHTSRNITGDMLHVSGFSQAEWPWQITEDARWTRYRPSAVGILDFDSQMFTNWYQFRLRNDSGDRQKLFLTIDNHFLKTVDVFVFNSAGALERVWRTGSERGLGTKPYPGSNYAFPLLIDNHDRKQIFIRVGSSFNAQLSVNMISEVKFGRLDTLEKISGGLILGITCLVFLYTMLLFIFLQDRKFFYYAVFTLSISMCLWLTGCYLTLFPSLFAGWDSFKFYLFFNYLMLWGLLFSCSGYFIFNRARVGTFYVPGSKPNRLNRLARIVGSVFFSNWSSPFGAAVGLMSILILSAAVLNWVIPVHISFLLLDLFLALMLVWGCVFFVISLRQRNFVHVGYSTAIMLFLVGTIIPGLRLMGVVYSDTWVRASFFVVSGAVAIVVVISLIYGAYAEKHRKLVANNISKARKRRFDEIYKYASEGMFTINVDGVFKQVNPAFCKMLGCHDFRELVAGGSLRFHDICENPRDFEDLVARLVSYKRHDDAVHLGDQNSFIVDGEIKLKTRTDKILMCSLRIRVSNSYDPLIYSAQKNEGIVIEGEITDLSANHGYQEMLDYVKTHDELTSLYNRSYMMTKLQEVLEKIPGGMLTLAQSAEQGDLPKPSGALHAKATDGPVFGCNYLCFISVNNFKFIYDALGHEGGDDFVKKIAQFLLKNVPESFSVIRLNGSEFAVVMTDSYVDQTLDCAEKWRSGLASMRYEAGDNIFGVSANIGVVDMAYANGDLSKLLTLADLTCEKARYMGQNTLLFYSKDIVTASDCSEDIRYSTILFRALDNGLIFAAKQEIVPMDKSRADWMGELFVRVRDEHGNVYEPHEFIGYATCQNIMSQIDEWVISCIVNTWTAGGNGFSLRSAKSVFINISEATICDLVLWGRLYALLAPHRELCTKLCFEIAESIMSSHMDYVVNFVKRFRELGVRIALDACGEGQANTFFAVTKVEPDFIKVSAQYTRSICESASSGVVVKSMLTLAKDLKIKTIALNVENAKEYAKFQELGVDYCQGYYVSSVEKAGLTSISPASANDGCIKNIARG